MRNRFAGHGSAWFKNRAVRRRLSIEAHHADARDLGTRIDVEAFLAAPTEDFEPYDLDHEIAARAFRARANRFLRRIPPASQNVLAGR